MVCDESTRSKLLNGQQVENGDCYGGEGSILSLQLLSYSLKPQQSPAMHGTYLDKRGIKWQIRKY
jgi:hypothetical protein